ncbi:hypothetical protein T05_15881 [Trichinella murrelli]|uniref:Uncharacterized protein n=1 Tax=Trichinella murrelli TaxID=144512 RepID=A0A0V0TY07_9BILA|nr:hypothetical protein T05_15881 [Trichinella murrelli]
MEKLFHTNWQWKRLIVRIPLEVVLFDCAPLHVIGLLSLPNSSCQAQERSVLIYFREKPFSMSSIFVDMRGPVLAKTMVSNMKIISSQLTVRVPLWKRPFVRIPLKVDMVVCALLQSEHSICRIKKPCKV